jgi:hypothetical protein
VIFLQGRPYVLPSSKIPPFLNLGGNFIEKEGESHFQPPKNLGSDFLGWGDCSPNLEVLMSICS